MSQEEEFEDEKGEGSDEKKGLNDHLIRIEQIIPDQIFIIPIHGSPIFPGIMAPILINQSKILEAIQEIGEGLDFVGLLLVRGEEDEEVRGASLYGVGTLVKVVKKIHLPDGGMNLLINSLKRFKVKEYINETSGRLVARVEYPEEVLMKGEVEENVDIEIKALSRAILKCLRELGEENSFLMEQIKLTLANMDNPSRIGDFAVSILRLKKEESQEILEIFDIRERLNRVLECLDKEVKLMVLQKRINKQINQEIDQKQREFFLREQLKAIKKELKMEDSDQGKEYRRFRKKIEGFKLEGKVKEEVERELEKFKNLDSHSSEYSVTRNYLDVICGLPWGKMSEDRDDIGEAEGILEKDHYGLKDVKERIMEFLAVRKLSVKKGGSMICFVGPPGVGKTSLGKSIARALGRKFYRFSLGGMRDEAEIKGHRRTYVGAMPGKIIMGIKRSGTMNPVFMLDEIDKIGLSYQGDPGSALLEVLDSEQNDKFVDHYLDLEFDLSNILFITTANSIETIPGPLLDRMEVIRLSGYIEEEKYEIGKRYLLKKQLEGHGLEGEDLRITEEGYRVMINDYARESGVRGLERMIERVCRKVAFLLVKGVGYGKEVGGEEVKKYLGVKKYYDDDYGKLNRHGVSIGLAWTSIGGSVIYIESIELDQEKGGFQLTGQLGDVMRESGDIALSYVRKISEEEELKEKYFDRKKIHLHVPAGATPKDGPSAGITMAASLLSLIWRVPIQKKIGMTGELTLTGNVLPIGGLKEKIIAAKRNKLEEVIFPKANRRDFEEIPENVRRGLIFHEVERFEEVIHCVFEGRVGVGGGS